ncbi:MAG: hypothetical protein ACRD96_28325 [Bryobacteraceae bacterium]
MVTVFQSNDPLAIGLAKGLLVDSGFAFWVQGNETEARLGLAPIMFPFCRFVVSSDCEAEARELLETLQPPP